MTAEDLVSRIHRFQTFWGAMPKRIVMNASHVRSVLEDLSENAQAIHADQAPPKPHITGMNYAFTFLGIPVFESKIDGEDSPWLVLP